MDLLQRLRQICPQDQEVLEEYIKTIEQAAVLFAKKQADYGPGNIAKFGEIGLLVRMSDKLERLINLITSKREPNNEAIEDTLLDILNYAAIWLIVRRVSIPHR